MCMNRFVLSIGFLFILLSCRTAVKEDMNRQNMMEEERLSIGNFWGPDLKLLAGFGMDTGKRMADKCPNLNKRPGMCAKLPMETDGIVRLSKIEVYPEFLEEYMKCVAEVGEVSLCTEAGVLTMYAVCEKENPCRVTILETYASKKAYDAHIASAHFRKYKQETRHMVKSLVLSDQIPINPANRIENFIQQAR